MNQTGTKTALTYLVAAAAALICSGCGGGSGPAGGGGGGGGGGTDARSVLIASIEAKCETFDGSDMDQENQQMLAFLKTKPDFVETGAGSDGAWGKFADGTYLVVGNNLDAASATKLARTRAIASGHTRAGGIPNKLNVILGTSLGDWYDDFLEPFVPKLFDTQNYGRVRPDSSVDGLKNLFNISVLHLFGHGFLCDIRKPLPRVFAAWTSTVRSKANDELYKADLVDGSLITITSLAFHSDPNISVKKKWETHYAITSKFVNKYWSGKFDSDSLVFINTCNSANDDALEFESACLNAGASYYLGWSDRMRLGEAISTASYLFDRLLGTNTDAMGPNAKETPPQRAFDLMAVLQEMGTRMRNGIPYPFDTTQPDPEKRGDPPVKAKLKFLTTNGNFQQLAPSIEFIGVDEQRDELTITGFFGTTSKDASVSIGVPGAQTNLPIKSFDVNNIVCSLPRSGAGASGGVMVSLNKSAQHSNVVWLTEYNGTAKATRIGEGTLKMEMNFVLHFRTSWQFSRLEPHGDPLSSGAHDFQHSLTSNGTYTFSGKHDSADGRLTEMWSGSGALPAAVVQASGGDPQQSAFGFVGGFNDDHRWRFDPSAIAYKGNHLRTIGRDANGNVTSDTTVDTSGLWISLGDLNGGMWTSTVGPDYNVIAGSATHSTGAFTYDTLEWSAMAAISPPDPKAARSVRVKSRKVMKALLR